MDDELILISTDYREDELGQRIPFEVFRPVFCVISSASRAEWRNAAVAGLRAELTAVMPACNYSGEETAEHDGARYTIYRTFVRDGGDTIELHLQRRAGA